MNEWTLWEVFVRSQNGAAHRHIGSVRASGAAMALQYARDIYTRRDDFVSLWLLPAEHLVSSAGLAKESWFCGARDKDYRHASHYPVPEGVQHL